MLADASWLSRRSDHQAIASLHVEHQRQGFPPKCLSALLGPYRRVLGHHTAAGLTVLHLRPQKHLRRLRPVGLGIQREEKVWGRELPPPKPFLVVKQRDSLLRKIANRKHLALVGAASPKLRETRNIGHDPSLLHRVLLDPSRVLGDPSLHDRGDLARELAGPEPVSIEQHPWLGCKDLFVRISP